MGPTLGGGHRPGPTRPCRVFCPSFPRNDERNEEESPTGRQHRREVPEGQRPLKDEASASESGISQRSLFFFNPSHLKVMNSFPDRARLWPGGSEPGPPRQQLQKEHEEPGPKQSHFLQKISTSTGARLSFARQEPDRQVTGEDQRGSKRSERPQRPPGDREHQHRNDGDSPNPGLCPPQNFQGSRTGSFLALESHLKPT